MAKKEKDGCVKPARGVLIESPESNGSAEAVREVANHPLARVGKKAIDFEANAYIQGKGFQTVKLSDYKGKWIVLCFYPGDFTFV